MGGWEGEGKEREQEGGGKVGWEGGVQDWIGSRTLQGGAMALLPLGGSAHVLQGDSAPPPSSSA